MRWAAVLCASLLCAACVKIDEPRPYACTPDGGSDEAQCPKDWRCGLNGICHAKGVEAEYVCNADTDCEGNFRCGLERLCHKKGEAKNYLCAADTDCEGGWRCSREGRCVAPPDDSLQLSTFPKSVAPFALESPLIDAHGGVKLAQSPLFDLPDGGTAPQEVTVVWFPDGGLSEYRRLLPPPGDNTFDLGTVEIRALPFSEQRVKELGFAEKRLYVLRDVPDAGTALDLIISEPKLNIPPTLLPALAAFDTDAQLRMADRADGPAVVFDQHGYRFFYGPWQTGDAGARQLPLLQTDAGTLYDMSWVGAQTWFGFELASTSQGLFITDDITPLFTAETWHALAGELAPNPGCGAVPDSGFVFTHRQLRPIGNVGFASVVHIDLPDGGSGDELVAYVFVSGALDNFVSLGALGAFGRPVFPATHEDGGCDSAPANLFKIFGPCQSCPSPYDNLLDFHLLQASDGGFEMELRCESEAPGLEGQQIYEVLRDERSFTGEECARGEVIVEPSSSRFVVQRANGAKATRLETTHGKLWSGVTESTASPLFLDRPATMILASSDGGLLLSAEGVLALQKPGAGYLATSASGTDALSHIDGRSNLVVVPEGVFAFEGLSNTGAKIIALPPGGPDPGPGAQLGTLLKTSENTTELVVTDFDTLYSADITSALYDGGSANQLQVRAAFARTPIRSLAASLPQPDAGSSYAIVYAQTASGVFEVKAETRNRWRSTDIALADDPVRLFSDGTRARAGFSDGTVVGLPSALTLAPPLDVSLQPATDFASVCGQPWVLARGGLFKLSASDGGAEGSWEPVKVETPDRPYLNATPGDLFERGRIYFRDNKVWIFFADGTAFTAKAVCP
ncbi:MAG: hypothetical protein ACJ790_16700 [Myxococcaceae bacterium]